MGQRSFPLAMNVKIPARDFVGSDMLILTVTERGQRPRQLPPHAKGEGQVKGAMLPDFQTSSTAAGVEMAWSW